MLHRPVPAPPSASALELVVVVDVEVVVEVQQLVDLSKVVETVVKRPRDLHPRRVALQCLLESHLGLPLLPEGLEVEVLVVGAALRRQGLLILFIPPPPQLQPWAAWVVPVPAPCR